MALWLLCLHSAEQHLAQRDIAASHEQKKQGTKLRFRSWKRQFKLLYSILELYWDCGKENGNYYLHIVGCKTIQKIFGHVFVSSTPYR